MQNNLPIVIILVLEVNAGILVNAFIIFVAYRDLITTKTVSNSYKILVVLAFFNVCYGLMMWVGLLDYFCRFGIFTNIYTTYIFLYVLLFIISFCTWLTSNLGFFYFIKMSNFESGFFFWARYNISSVVPWMLLVDLLLSLLCSVLSVLYFIFSEI
uniref:NADH dehydrogenase subunit 6 n=1 Tax=Pyxicephalus adspersus TaxID=30357 RepID=A0AAV2ZYZ7_PYXAD|nr:TPA: hypothetical protein GDO54_014782 [Pyxicephalus adspersus]